MRRSLRRPVAAVAVGALGMLAAIAGPVVAQDDGQEGEASRVIAPEECQAEPRPVDEVVALLSADGGSPAGPQIRVPFGDLAGGGVSDGVTEGVRQVLACINAGDPARATAGLSDDGVRRFWGFVSGGATDVEAAREQLTAPPTPLEEEQRLRLIAVTDVARLEGERQVAALVVVNDPRRVPRGAETLLMTFVRDGERYVIDSGLVFTRVPPPAGSPTAGTPTAGTPAP